MKKYIFYFAWFLALAVFGLAQVYGSKDSDGSNSSQDKVAGQYIVVFKDGVDNPGQAVKEIAAVHGLGVLYKYDHALKGFAAVIPPARLAAVKNDPRVDFISEDRFVSIDARGGIPGRPSPTPDPTPTASPTPTPTPVSSEILPTGVDRVNAESKANTGAGVNVAVIDTGIDYTHPDLATNVVGGKNCSTGKSYNDGNGHGTHVAGTIAALHNDYGVVGVAPGAKLWAVRVLNNAGSGTWSSVICGVDFVTAHAPANGGPITVANMSLGGGGTSDNNCGNTNGDALHKAICRSRDAGVTYVVAAGNNGADASGSVPASYDDAVITVSALADSDGQPGGLGLSTNYGADDTFASFSNYGSVVDLGAPGVDIFSTWKGGGYNTISGTSMATPHVTGAAALYIATHPGAVWTAVRDDLKAAGELTGFGHTDTSGLHPEPVVRADSL